MEWSCHCEACGRICRIIKPIELDVILFCPFCASPSISVTGIRTGREAHILRASDFKPIGSGGAGGDPNR